MCGIYGYYGVSQNASNIILSGLKSLDYRGYDSWGIATLKNNEIFIQKEVGKIENIYKLNLPQSNLALGHTRWATTGNVTQVNAHPHFSSDKSFALVQNGIVDNFESLKSELVTKGYSFTSQTDTEVIVRLIEDCQKKTKNLTKAFIQAFLKLKGRNTVALIDSQNHQILAARNGSPLVLGKSNLDYFLSSDTLSLSTNADQFFDLDNYQMLILNSRPQIINLKDNKKVKLNFKKIKFDLGLINKEKYNHFMQKEIFETPNVIKQVTKTNLTLLLKLAKAVKKAETVYTIGSGTAGNAAAQIAFYLRQYSRIKAVSLIGADAIEYLPLFTKKDLIIAPSQSGETADVLEVLEYAKSKKIPIATYVNMPGSSMTRLSDYSFMSQAGPEICVMSTKVFTSQISWGYLLAQTVIGNYKLAIKNLLLLANEAEKYLKDLKNIKLIKNIAQVLINTNDIFLLGKSQNYQIAKEGMIKLIEGTYKHAHAIPAGDLKHYAITLIDENIYTITVLSNDSTLNDMNNAINEIRSRGGSIIAVCNKKQDNFDFHIKTPKLGETSSIFNIIPLQLLSYYLACKLGNNVDKPRNIAKSVTVK